MNKVKSKYFVLVLFFLCGLLAFLTTKAWTIFSIKRPMDCAELGLQNLEPMKGTATCSSRTYIFGTYYEAVLKKYHADGPLKYSFSNTHKFNLTNQSIRPPLGALVVTDMAGKQVLWAGNEVATQWSGMTREAISLGGTEGPVKLVLGSESESFIYFTTDTSEKLKSHFFKFIVLAIVALCIPVLMRASSPKWSRLALLSTALSVVVLRCGIPFGSSAGWFDPGDDLSYLHWTYSLGYLLDPDLTHSSFIPSWALNHNHHSWGTGLVLAPFLIPARLTGLGAVPGTIHFGLMNFGVIIVGCLSVVMTFKVFELFSPWRAAMAVALLSLISTSMLKWMFMRNFFSHVPEFFALSIATYFFVQRYFKNKIGTKTMAGMSLGLCLLVQIRREDAVFFALPIIFELLQLNRTRMERFKSCVFIGAVGFGSLLLLNFTNYFTQLKSFFGNVRVQQDFYTENLLDVFLRQAPEIFYGSSYGLFYWKNAFAWLAVFACALERRAWRRWLPMAGVVLFYLLLCSFHRYPNGMEWQNRFLLKLNPILFGGALIVLTKAPRFFRWSGWAWMIASAWMEITNYFEILPKRMHFFISDFSDHMLMYPQNWPGPWMSLFYLPLIVVWMVSTCLWFKVYLTMRKSV